LNIIILRIVFEKEQIKKVKCPFSIGGKKIDYLNNKMLDLPTKIKNNFI